jgi:cyclophilin family peptidyl-prolyl cis-trans isomerase
MINRRQALAHLGALAALPASAALTTPTAGTGTMVRWLTNLGPIDLQLYDSAAPLTVANFLAYVNSGAYAGSFFHRSMPKFVVQGGGFIWPAGAAAPQAVPKRAAVANEFSATRSNLRGTIAMAKSEGNPNSATSEWFVNLANNASNLDAQNGGFTVFGRVTTSGMLVFDKIEALRIVNGGGVYSNLPVVNLTTNTIGADNVVRASAVTVLGRESDSDRIFNYLEGVYPQYVPVAGQSAGTGLGYYFRYYPGTNSYVGTKDGNVHYLVPSISPDVQPLGSMADWLGAAAAEGY